MNFVYQNDAERCEVQVEPQGEMVIVSAAGRRRQVRVLWTRAGEWGLEVDGVRRVARVARQGAERWVALDGVVFHLTVPRADERARRAARRAGHAALEAPMPGVVRQVLVEPGQPVERGQTLLVLEAMKMELKVAAPAAGRVEAVRVRVGQTVGRGDILVDVAD